MHCNMKRTSLEKGKIYTSMCLAAEKGMYTSYLRGTRCKAEDVFFREVSASFQFPYYFGENWDAFDECICDLEWLNVSSIFLVIDDFSQMFSNQKEIQNLLQDRVTQYFENMITCWEAKNIPVEVWLNN